MTRVTLTNYALETLGVLLLDWCDRPPQFSGLSPCHCQVGHPPTSLHSTLHLARIVPRYGMVWYTVVEFNVPLDTVYVISETGGPEQ